MYVLVFVFTLTWGDAPGVQQATVLDAFRSPAVCEYWRRDWDAFIAPQMREGDESASYCLPILDTIKPGR